MTPITRRSALLLPMLTLPALGLRAAPAVPPFPHWVGKTAQLRGDGGAARLLLAEDGTGLMTVKLLLLCRALPIRSWQLGEDGLSVRYTRVSALDPARLIPGEARILPEPGRVRWVEAREHTAEFDRFLDPAEARSCS